jgi:GTP-binding protein
VNIQKGKQLTNMRTSGSDNNVKVVPKKQFSLEEAIEYIQKDEYLEVTLKSIRMRKFWLNENYRKRYDKKAEAL